MPPVHHFERDGVEIEEFEAQVLVLNVPIALCRSSNLPVARNEASQEMLSFLVELIAKKASRNYEPPPRASIPRNEPSYPRHHVHLSTSRPPVDSYHDNSNASVHSSYSEDQIMDADSRYTNREPEHHTKFEEPRNAMYLKRRYEPKREDRHDEPQLTRRRVEDPAQGSQYPTQHDRQHQPATASQTNGSSNHSSSSEKPEGSREPVFFVDNAGERKPHADRTMKKLTEEQQIQSEVDGYQELVAQMFKNRDHVMAKLDSIVWDTNREIEYIEFDSKLMVSNW